MRKSCNSTELAEIIGVTKSAISQAVVSGRLSGSIVSREARNNKFEIYKACLEWENARDNSQVRDPALQSPQNQSNPNFPPIAESRQAYEYYQAANEQLSALKEAGRLIDLDITQRELFQAARIVRDRLQEIPEKLRFNFLALGVSDADTNELVRSLTEEIYQALLFLSETDVSLLREEQLSRPVKDVSDGIIGIDHAGR
jgi:phage terminase Nu1 subunit (DNA packaging protein)